MDIGIIQLKQKKNEKELKEHLSIQSQAITTIKKTETEGEKKEKKKENTEQ